MPDGPRRITKEEGGEWGGIDGVSLKLANLEQIPPQGDGRQRRRGARTNRSKCEDSKFSPRGPIGGYGRSDGRMDEMEKMMKRARGNVHVAGGGGEDEEHLENVEGRGGQAGTGQACETQGRTEGGRDLPSPPPAPVGRRRRRRNPDLIPLPPSLPIIIAAV